MNKNHFKKAYFLLFFITLTGCGANYINPEGQDVAKVQIASPSFIGFNNLTMIVYPNYSCKDFQVLDVLTRPSQPPININALPGQVLVINFHFINNKPDFVAGGSLSDTVAYKTIAFTPKPRTRYEISYNSNTEPVVYELYSTTKELIDSTAKSEC